MRIKIEISPGELIDKLTILAIKEERIDTPQKLGNIRRERQSLEAAIALALGDGALGEKALGDGAPLAVMAAELKAVNEILWDVEDGIREQEAAGDFGPRFVELARAVYRTNDRRAAIKRQINEHLQSDIAEEKSYRDYRRA